MPGNIVRQAKKTQATDALLVGAYSPSMYASLLNKPRYVRHREFMSKTRKQVTINW